MVDVRSTPLFSRNLCVRVYFFISLLLLPVIIVHAGWSVRTPNQTERHLFRVVAFINEPNKTISIFISLPPSLTRSLSRSPALVATIFLAL